MSGSGAGTDGRSGVLLLGNRRQSLTVIRALRSDGWAVVVGRDEADDRDYHAYRSRGVAEVWRHASWKGDPSAFDGQLMRFLEARPWVRVVFPVDESAVRRVDGLRGEMGARFGERVGLAVANPGAVETCLDKGRMLEACRSAGVPHAGYEVVGGDELGGAMERVGLPCVVKPMDHETLRFGVKAEIVREAGEAEALAGDGAMAGRRLMVQGYAAGPRHNVYFAADGGRLVGAVEVRIDRTDRVDGTGLAVSGRTVEPTPALIADTEALVGALGYRGVGCAQFLYEGEESSRCFLELNPRLGANFAVVYRAGLRLPELAVRLAGGERLEVPADALAYRRGLRFAWTFGAWAGCRFERRQGVIGWGRAARLMGRAGWAGVRAAWPGLRGGVHITWSWRDPLPSLLEMSRPLRRRATRAAAVDPKPTAAGRLSPSEASGAAVGGAR
ncbi:MAG: hypothetical protein AAF750_00430 [Planctomycetota bacterium]